jgi:predicted membrane channel-forming protein YqfA (hemolysin III family)
VPLLAALVAQIPDLPGLSDEGPDDLESLLTLCFVLMGAGFVIGLLGHIIRSRVLVAIGIVLVMAGTVVFVLAVGRYG